MSEFTSGKWFECRHDAKAGKHSRLKVVAGVRVSEGAIKSIATISGSGTEAQANARLIAAAPELYELLKDCARTAPPGHYTEALLELQDKARALLARLEKECVEE